MVQLYEKQRMEVSMMLGYGDRAKTYQEMYQLFREKYPDQHIKKSTISRIEKTFAENGFVKNLPKTGHPAILNEDAQLPGRWIGIRGLMDDRLGLI
jgi:Fe2+ or Zn2+ uptake regulation protein